MPAPGFSLEATLANERVWSVVDAVDEAWHDLREALLGALEYDDLGTPHLDGCEAAIPAAVRRVEEAERVAHAEVAATRAMLS
jgi:hypothetical protein